MGWDTFILNFFFTTKSLLWLHFKNRYTLVTENRKIMFQNNTIFFPVFRLVIKLSEVLKKVGEDKWFTTKYIFLSNINIFAKNNILPDNLLKLLHVLGLVEGVPEHNFDQVVLLNPGSHSVSCQPILHQQHHQIN